MSENSFNPNPDLPIVYLNPTENVTPENPTKNPTVESVEATIESRAADYRASLL